jgi:hypothetical protein
MSESATIGRSRPPLGAAPCRWFIKESRGLAHTQPFFIGAFGSAHVFLKNIVPTCLLNFFETEYNYGNR